MITFTRLEFKVFSLCNKGGNLEILISVVLGAEILVTRDPENVRAIFATRASSFEIGASR